MLGIVCSAPQTTLVEVSGGTFACYLTLRPVCHMRTSTAMTSKRTISESEFRPTSFHAHPRPRPHPHALPQPAADLPSTLRHRRDFQLHHPCLTRVAHPERLTRHVLSTDLRNTTRSSCYDLVATLMLEGHVCGRAQAPRTLHARRRDPLQRALARRRRCAAALARPSLPIARACWRAAYMLGARPRLSTRRVYAAQTTRAGMWRPSTSATTTSRTRWAPRVRPAAVAGR